MAMISSLITASSPSKLEKYNFTISSKIQNDSMAFNDAEAAFQMVEIEKCYNKVKSCFYNIADEYAKAAKSNMLDAELKKSLERTAKQCRNQGNYCKDKVKLMKDKFDDDMRILNMLKHFPAKG